jgi:hypothetical protein
MVHNQSSSLGHGHPVRKSSITSSLRLHHKYPYMHSQKCSAHTQLNFVPFLNIEVQAVFCAQQPQFLYQPDLDHLGCLGGGTRQRYRPPGGRKWVRSTWSRSSLRPASLGRRRPRPSKMAAPIGPAVAAAFLGTRTRISPRSSNRLRWTIRIRLHRPQRTTSSGKR